MNIVGRLASIHRYPIKGFAGQTLPTAELQPGTGIPFDRVFAIANGERPLAPSDAWTPCQAFVRLTRNQNLYSFGIELDEIGRTATLRMPDGRTIDLGLIDPSGDAGERLDALRNWFGTAAAPVARGRGEAGYWDHEDAVVSIINVETVALLSRAAGRWLDPLRFRGNLYLDAPSGSEHGLIGRRIRVGGDDGAILEILRPIDRCRATSLDPTTGDGSLNVPALMERTLGHVFCGVYARVVGGGPIRARDAVHDLGSAPASLSDAARVATAPPVAHWPRMARVVRRVEDSQTVTSFWLDDPLSALRPKPRAGQHIRVHLMEPDAGTTWRAYTISALAGSQMRMSVKHDGSASSRLHEILTPGASLLISGPFGDIVLPPPTESVARPLVLLSAGIGITPTVAMLRELAEQNDLRRVVVHHVARNEEDLALWHEVETAMCRLPSGLARLHLTRASAETCATLGAEPGRPDWAALMDAMDVAAADLFLCGPSGFVTDLHRHLSKAGASPERIRTEAFVSPRTTVCEPRAGTRPEDIASKSCIPLRFARAGIDTVWTLDRGTLLEAAEVAGLTLPAHCRSGVCGTCKARVLRGSVVHDPPPALAPPAGTALLCCAYPAAGEEILIVDA